MCVYVGIGYTTNYYIVFKMRIHNNHNATVFTIKMNYPYQWVIPHSYGNLEVTNSNSITY